MHTQTHTLTQVAQKLAEQKPDIDYLKYINPRNFASEKKKFLRHFYAGEVYNPQYQYQKTAHRFSRQEQVLDECTKELESSGARSDLSALCTHEITDQKRRIALIRAIGTQAIHKEAQALFGGINRSLVRQSATGKARTASLFPISGGGTLSQPALLKKARHFFRIHGFVGWKADINVPGAPSVCRTHEKKVLFQNMEEYDERFVDILLSHEVLGHAYQEEASASAPHALFHVGFGLYEVLLEGYATYQEREINPLLLDRLGSYYLAVARAEDHDFFSTFTYLLQWHSIDDAYHLASRAKRGMCDTSMPGTWYKDKVYLEGYREMERLTPAERDLVTRAKFDHRKMSLARSLLVR